ncbi:uncharacterized protein ASCRUDRAFT_70540 [Ascoidea rubescens DSM 1968]|uniref:Uncharacterized protein n=1 Tax=Ascoidea rubescens DSM 1968 TaxID=1344418 RepID=A0A1D2VG34_9ASCO|nr:hypothetical protein ASCRUDRAFT_70540 [Ascoidea rubescens DSM 1968]ODV60644.1 hypothetical protein ASCRUDRAFT_70540 [Ascoidea rubescens DSM 1968]
MNKFAKENNSSSNLSFEVYLKQRNDLCKTFSIDLTKEFLSNFEAQALKEFKAPSAKGLINGVESTIPNEKDHFQYKSTRGTFLFKDTTVIHDIIMQNHFEPDILLDHQNMSY